MVRRVKGEVNRAGNRDWDVAIADVRLKLEEAKKRAEKLSKILENWSRLRDQGMAWPGAATRN